ncbi:MAG TPA: NAD-glutamate dehydrogenase [Actinomycetes bacterium]|nr:NAD-glutamate dehydrogenase [Actinomycetes bacterium]
MSTQPEQAKAEILQQIVATIHEKVPEDRRDQVEEFARQYYQRLAPEDLLELEPEDLYGAVLAHWRLAHRRQPGEAKVRVYSPRFEEHGWRSKHSIVEIVTDDMPFLVDSVAMELNRNSLVIHLPIHPVIAVRRDEAGGLVEVLPPDAGDGVRESYLHFEVDRQSEPEVLDRLRAEIERVLADVKASVEDWSAMREQVRSILAELDERPPPIDDDELAEARALLQWIEDHHFTFLGYRSYDLVQEDGQDMLRPVPGTGLGILRQGQTKPASGSFAKLPPEARRLAREPHILVLTKANSHSTVHRPSYLDYIGVKRFDEQGQVVGERRFLGLYTSAAYNRNPRDIPVLRRKVAKVLERAGTPRYSHDWKSLLNILETFPRDELFQISDDQLFETAMGILRLEERRRVRLFMWHDNYGRFVSALVYVPRDRYTTTVRRRIEAVLHEAFPGASFDFQVWLSESVLARLHFIIRLRPGEMPSYDAKELEAKLATVTRSWNDDLHALLLELHGEEEGNALFSAYGEAFPAAYVDDFPPRNAVYDIQRMEDLAERGGLNMNLYRPLEAPPGTLRFKLFWADRPLPLSDAVPMLEDMGVEVVEERPYELHPPGQGPVWIHDFGVTYTGDGEVDLSRVRDVFQDAFAAILRGGADSDGFNRLVLRARLTWRQIVVLRAYCKYLRQTRLAFSQEYMEQALAGNPQIARWLVELFESRFDPTQPEGAEARAEQLRERLAESIDQVANLDEDRILRSFLGMVEATLRTNCFQKGLDGQPKPYLSFKLNPAQVPTLPKPRPMFEVFVYSPRTEAVHLRGGKVARGGIRWSDRREDFRTEILGLMKAQMVKNAVIVPVGAKGGFVVKQPPAEGGREALMDEVVACYSTMMRGLLDITDNRADGKVVPPADVVRYDDDDPYLVVAADKGTATFSDLANSIAQEYGFWLDDAFASGGSAGYDHKKMGITARGAWESVKQLFRERGVDTQSTDFTVVGIGDMSGDVFGNGMLLSRHIKLIGAFNHLHVFLDPDPDPEASFTERERLFALPRSSWSDYDPAKISEGGGVWPRSAKSIPLSEQVRRALDVQAEALTPSELINAMLKAPVDLLWNGGIGTYVKAAREIHADVGDRANDAVRVNGGELQAKVVGEGGNLGFTQLGRVEYALHGGRINTDFIDNSGGVDCSDHEVNIKILLNQVVNDGDMTRKQRDKLLADMTDDVAQAVLQDNYRQVQAISVTEAQAPQLLDEHDRLMRSLERARRLDRRLEFLPNDEELAERRAAGRGLTRPELAVLLAYAKIALQDELAASDVPDDEYLADDLERYMPPKLRERFRRQLRRHPLRRDIIATYVTNSMVNRAGSTFANRLRDETGARPPDVARAYTVAREVFDIRRLWKDLAALDNVVPADVQLELQAEGRKMIERSALWFLRNRRQPLSIAATVSHFAPGIASLAQELPKLLAPDDSEALDRLAERFALAGVPPELATRVASLDALFSGLNVIEVATSCGETVETVAAVYFALGYKLDLHWLRDQIARLPAETHWQTLAQGALRDDLYSEQRELTIEVLKRGTKDGTEDKDAEALIEAWLEENRSAVERANTILSDLREAETLDIAMLSVALREIRNLSETGSATIGAPATS